MILRRWYVVAGLAWFIRYATLGHIPPWQQPIWRDWFDQSRYLASALALSHGDLSAGQHWYPLGYPLLAAPFAWLLPSDPFFLLDLLLFLTTCAAFRRIVDRLDISVWPATGCFLAATLIQSGLASAWVHPWTTTLSAALIWWLIERTLIICEGAGDRRALTTMGALVGALPLVRPVDALISMTCLAIVAAALLRQRRFSPSALIRIAAGGALVCGVYAALHLAIYGPHPTPYMIAAAQTGFIVGDLGWKAYVLLVDPRPWFPEARSMLQVLPWLVPGCAGLLAHAVVASRPGRLTIVLLFVTILPVSAIMLTYADLQPPGLWSFFNMHYFTWAMPAFAAGLLLCWRLLWDRSGRRWLAVAMAALLLPLGIRVMPIAVDARTPARMLFFRGDTHRDWQEAYFASVVITDDNGLMRNVGDFHQVPDPAGERAIAISRLFGHDPRRADPGEPQVRFGQRPYARFGERVSFLGLP